MSRRLVDFDPFTGIAHYSEWNELDDAIRFTAVQDADNIIDFNKWQRSQAPARFGDMAHVARIPMPLFQKLWEQGIIQDKKRFMAWCRDPDNRAFLVRDGKVI
jgi:hypothetical protein